MPVTFSTDSHPRVIQFDHVAKSLLAMMGHGDAVPGALRPGDVARAAENLRDALSKLEKIDEVEKHQEDPSSHDDDDAKIVPMTHRAQPLLDLLDAAADSNNHVMWE